MGQPIKDRGIRWVETYGEKSAHLKKECESQIGPGSYFRWEGHDHTTGFDYYVVISPGFSKKHGYHFFAGLRKMTGDDQGASGKKFKTQREALSYAVDKWRIPPPEIKPGKPYTANDLVGKEIVMENVHAASDAFMTKTSMSLQGSGGIDVEWARRVGPKVLTEMYCFAHKASKAMGFLSGLYSRLRVFGVDGLNSTENQQGHDLFTGQKGPLPVAPLLATCDSPSDAAFQQDVYGDQVTMDNELVEMDRDESKETGRNAVKGINYKQQFRPDEGPGYKLNRWRHMTLTPTVGFTVPPDEAWLQSLAQMGINHEAPAADKGVARGRRDIRFQVPSEMWDRFESEVLARKGHVFDLRGSQKKFVDLLNYRKSRGETIDQDLDKPYYESISMKGSQLLAYDDMGIPVHLKSRYISPTGVAVDKTYVLRNPDGLVSQWGDTELGKLAIAREEAAKNAARNPLDPNLPQQQQQIQQQILALIEQIKSGQRKPVVTAEDPQAMLRGFRELAAHGGVPIASTDVAIAETCAPVLGNTKTVTPIVDNTLLPLNRQFGLANPEDLRQKGWEKGVAPYVPEYTIKARKQRMGEQEHHAARWYDKEKGAYVYGPLPEGVDPVQKMNGTAVVADKTFMYIAKGDGAVHEVEAGESKLYNPNSKNSFIPGALYDVILAPEYASSKGTDKRLVNKLGHDRNGWTIHFQEHQLKKVKGEISTPRQKASKKFSPGVNLDGEQVNLDGKDQPLSNFAYKQDGQVYFRDNMAAYAYLKKKLNLKDEEIGPLTRMTDSDLRIIDDMASDAVQYYEQVEKMPQEQRQGVDQDKYNYGRTIAKCKGGHEPPPEVMHQMAAALENPEEAFAPKTGTLWAIQHSGPQGSNWLTDDGGEVVLYGAQSQAEKALGMPAVRALTESGAQVSVQMYAQNTVMVPSLAKRMQADPSATLTTFGREMTEGIRSYANDLTHPEDPQEQQEQDPNAQEFAQDEPQQPAAPAAPPEVAVAPEPLQQAPQQAQPPVPTAQPMASGPTPEQWVQRYLSQRKSPSYISMLNNSLNSGNPQFMQDVSNLLQTMPPQQPQVRAATERLVKLANWLDEKGRRAEADRVDALIKKLSEQADLP